MNNTDEIEFSRVRKLVAGYAVSPEAKEKILAQPLANKSVKANALLDETEEMFWIFRSWPTSLLLIQMLLRQS